ncbi:hypothetical protein SEVIR_5G148000v4 [Setaria viridis]|uniref:Uncharacterized protein n=1 Tax=Setaria viridis TaxID=4556 RepID=A0A4U6UDR7_SETVI|nr:uncharacterized protein LOC117856788 isoform X1 [Setaria viridis]XP_034595069.1 uncharacterized protein LOC117856788 isoform X1 [Setaria viridis]TKW14140.1 hypothetical protein SEVIR_5G148000v2 [Setaria viridis]TKW14141.1 hypothetical protein SEVIR_5G148000v2 [Setaria viridis]
MVVVIAEAVCTNGGPQKVVAPGLATDRGGDAVECSSSFGDTSSGFEGEADGGEPEVDSVISADANGSGYSKLPRRKKVTAEWRDSVLPILWRCQWLELRVKELSSQVSKYDRELALIKKEKELQLAVSKANVSRLESRQIHKGHGDSIMKRRKRKRHEENVDGPLYITKHQILSYYNDKQNKGAETGGILIDDDCGSTVDGCIRGGLDTITLLNSENYDMIFEQLILKHTLMTIDGLQSRVHLLQDCLSKAHSGGENLVISEYSTHVRVPQERQHTQKHSFSYMECRYSKPRKRKNLNVLLKDDVSALAVRPALPDMETDAHLKDENRNAEERSGECNHLREKYVTMDQLLGTDNSIPNGHIGDLCKENTYDILIDNQAANVVHRQFGKAKHLPSGTSNKGPAETKNISAPAEVKNTCAPVDSTSAPAVEPVSPQSKELKPKKKRKKGSFLTKKKKKKKKETSKTPAKEKAEGTPSAAKNKTGGTPSAAAVEKTESAPSGSMGLGTMTARSARKKRKTGNEPADAKKRESVPSKKQETGKPSSAAKEETGKPSSAAKKQETGKPSSAAKKQETANAPSATKETESAPLNVKTEKAVLAVAINCRSQRVRKPKVFAE